MKIYIIKTETYIEPFGDPVSETLLFNHTLYENTTGNYSRVGLSPVFVSTPEEIPGKGPKYVTFDYVYLTIPLLRDFIKTVRKKNKNIRLGLSDSLFVRMNEPLQELDTGPGNGRMFDFYFLNDGEFQKNREWLDVLIDPEEDIKRIELPETLLSEEEARFPITSKQIWHIKHWVHILRVNYFGITGKAVELRESGKWRILMAVVRAHSLNKWRIAGKLNRIGKNCDIHPTAVIEASELGDGVRVGANALVRGSVLGDGVYVEDLAQVSFSTLGHGCMVHKTCILNYSVLYPETTSGNKILQFAVLGRGVITTHGSNLLDYSISPEPVRVEYKGEFKSTGSRYVGCCLGHGVKLGIGSYVAPGRAIPNGYKIVRDPSRTLFRIPGDLPRDTFLYVEDGTLVPIEDGKRTRGGK